MNRNDAEQRILNWFRKNVREELVKSHFKRPDKKMGGGLMEATQKLKLKAKWVGHDANL